MKNAAKPGFRPTREHVAGRGWVWEKLGLFSSLRMAASMIGLLAIVLAVATYYERDFGRDMAALVIYQSWWFNIIFGLLALNIFGAAAVRFPWHARQTGFVITHLGLLTLMAGFYVAGHNRLDGMLGVAEGDVGKDMDLDRDLISLRLESPDGAVQDTLSKGIQSNAHAGYPGFLRYCLSPIWSLPDQVLPPSDQVLPMGEIDGIPVAVGRIVDTGAEELGWERAPRGEGPIAVDLRISAQLPATTMSRQQWLTTAAGGRRSFELGPLAINLLDLPASADLEPLLEPVDPASLSDRGSLLVQVAGTVHRVPVPEELPARVPLGTDGTLTIQNYLADLAFDEQGQPYSQSEIHRNPVVFYRLTMGQGPEQITEAGAASHAGTIAGEVRAAVNLVHPILYRPAPDASPGGMVQILATRDGSFAVRRFSNKRGYVGGERVSSGWSGEAFAIPGGMSISMALPTLLEDARPAPIYRAMQPDAKHRATRWLEFIIGDEGERYWVAKNNGRQIDLPGERNLLINVRSHPYDIREHHGFALHLQEFENDTDPGGKSSATYASHVRVLPEYGEPYEYRISMNEPLTVAPDEGWAASWFGWLPPTLVPTSVTLYQTSFIRGDDGTEISFFTVAQDNGRLLKYIGSVVLTLGIVIMYVTMLVIRHRRRRPTAPPSQATQESPA